MINLLILFSDDRGSNSSPLLGFDESLYVGAGFGVVFAINPQTGGTDFNIYIRPVCFPIFFLCKLFSTIFNAIHTFHYVMKNRHWVQNFKSKSNICTLKTKLKLKIFICSIKTSVLITNKNDCDII